MGLLSASKVVPSVSPHGKEDKEILSVACFFSLLPLLSSLYRAQAGPKLLLHLPASVSEILELQA